MIISANGIIFNEYSDVLLIQRDDTRTLAPPGGSCEIDELPQNAAIREVREETGLKVHPVRLVGLYFLPTRPDAFLFLCFRCIQRGGELSTSAETPRSGYFATNPLPRPMLAFHREQIQRSFKHGGGPPYWGQHPVSPALHAKNFMLNRLVYPWLHFRRSRLGQPRFVPPPQWHVRAILILTNSNGEVLLARSKSLDSWALPASDSSASAAPWVKARQLIQETLNGHAKLHNLSGIYLRQGKAEMDFVFTGSLLKGRSLPAQYALYSPDSFPEDFLPDHDSIMQDALLSDMQTTYRLLE